MRPGISKAILGPGQSTAQGPVIRDEFQANLENLRLQQAVNHFLSSRSKLWLYQNRRLRVLTLGLEAEWIGRRDNNPEAAMLRRTAVPCS